MSQAHHRKYWAMKKRRAASQGDASRGGGAAKKRANSSPSVQEVEGAVQKNIAAHQKRVVARTGGETRTDADLSRMLPDKLCNALMPFQREGVLFALSHGGKVLIGDEMGLGKTIQAIATAFCYQHEWPLLVVVPGSLKYSWAEEIEKWLPVLKPGAVNFVASRSDIEGLGQHRVSIVTYGLFAGKSAVAEWIAKNPFAVVILDESHAIKSRSAQRTKLLTPVLKKARRAILLSGTPALARPAELHPQLAPIAPALFGTWTWFTKAFCDAKRGRFGMDFSGSSNLSQLRELLQQCMIRRLKANVLDQVRYRTCTRVRFCAWRHASVLCAALF